MADPYLQLLQEACENIGLLRGAWAYRKPVLEPEFRAAAPTDGAGQVGGRLGLPA